jgi:hypothetical protein
MPAGFVRVRNTATGAVSALPAGAVRHFPNHEVEDGPVPPRPKPRKKLPKSQANSSRVPAASNEQE